MQSIPNEVKEEKTMKDDVGYDVKERKRLNLAGTEHVGEKK